ncbi:MAG: glucose/arabinose dehydrogenase/cytochrome c553 [Gammaproteobacteria bacterium]|jgi:glucose/arabinose dehydrogenase/cytochrome c553
MLLNERCRLARSSIVLTGILFCACWNLVGADQVDQGDETETWKMIEFNTDTTGDYAAVYKENCAVCHGEQLEGTAQGTPLNGRLKYGDSVEVFENNIANGFAAKGMPAWSKTLSDVQIKNIALYISETRLGMNYGDFKYDAEFVVPKGVIKTEKNAFEFETVIDGIDALPFSIEPLPDGRVLLTEKKLGLSIVSAEGKQSTYIEGTPPVYADSYVFAVKQEWGNGWYFDVALHPNYEQNGWIYLQYGDRCSDCNEASRRFKLPVSMNTLIRGRIKDGRWIDEEMIWKNALEFYAPGPDLGAGGRITFDDEGHVFVSVGMKMNNHEGIQDLRTPWGKIHRLHDDGRVPVDNPFIKNPDAIKTIWTYGHRSPQGLEWRHASAELWGTEHGPRGGDEINLLVAGKNYGWPLTSKGMNYDGSSVEYGKKLGVEFDLKDIEQPVVDMSPSPAISSFVFYDGDQFPQWRGDLLVGSLKAQSLFRVELEGSQAVHTETLISGLARIRDIEVGFDGNVYLLLENNAGGRIVRMVPK